MHPYSPSDFEFQQGVEGQRLAVFVSEANCSLSCNNVWRGPSVTVKTGRRNERVQLHRASPTGLLLILQVLMSFGVLPSCLLALLSPAVDIHSTSLTTVPTWLKIAQPTNQEIGPCLSARPGL